MREGEELPEGCSGAARFKNEFLSERRASGEREETRGAAGAPDHEQIRVCSTHRAGKAAAPPESPGCPPCPALTASGGREERPHTRRVISREILIPEQQNLLTPSLSDEGAVFSLASEGAGAEISLSPPGVKLGGDNLCKHTLLPGS